MPKFRKRPVVIEAEQIKCVPFVKDWGTGVSIKLSPKFAAAVCMEDDAPDQTRGHVHTLEGTAHTLTDGDWIIKGIKGEFYPCKPDIFAATYEPVAEEGTEK